MTFDELYDSFYSPAMSAYVEALEALESRDRGEWDGSPQGPCGRSIEPGSGRSVSESYSWEEYAEHSLTSDPGRSTRCGDPRCDIHAYAACYEGDCQGGVQFGRHGIEHGAGTDGEAWHE